jgi:dihydropteroate synthase
MLPKLGRCAVLGVLNVTPDSFSDGGRFLDHDDAVRHGLELRAAGADFVDVGGESTRPGAVRIDAKTEIARVLPVIADLVAAGVAVSIDTTRAAVAAAAIEAGAALVNDVSAGLGDSGMAAVVASARVPWVLMHSRGAAGAHAGYEDVLGEVRAELVARVDAAVLAGVDPGRIVLDPGLGFAKNADQNWEVLGHLREFETLGYPVLIGASRKRFLGALLPEGTPTDDRDPASAVISALAAEAGAWGVRVHDVAATKAALDVWEAWSYGARSGGNPS